VDKRTQNLRVKNSKKGLEKLSSFTLKMGLKNHSFLVKRNKHYGR
jgi:hypothetical protein